MTRRTSSRELIVIIAAILQFMNEVSSICIFPPEFVGEYLLQRSLSYIDSSTSSGHLNGAPLINSDEVIQYSSINITSDLIFPFGQCIARNNSNYIVVLSPEENPCYRCFNLQLVSKNVILLIHNEIDINSKCSSSPESVRCPEDVTLTTDTSEPAELRSDFRSIVLFKISDGPETLRRNEFCPSDFFEGDIRFDYFHNDEKICGETESTISTCPSSSYLNVRFKSCNQPTFSTKYECIGHWRSNAMNYLALVEWINGTTKAKYKCGAYHYDDESTNKMTLQVFNNCSSFTSDGFISSNPYHQVFEIVKRPTQLRPTTEMSFPGWLHGQWQFFTIAESRIENYRDRGSFKSYQMTLVNQLSDEKFVVLSRSQCGEETFKCLWLRNLDTNLLEFQLGSESPVKLASFELCSDDKFDNSRWSTQSRVGKSLSRVSCPITGKYIGQLPDEMELCSALTSDCESPDIMNFQIGLCDFSEVYEKRTYRCLGQYMDKETNRVYTYTKRVDVVDSYECFVGIAMGSSESHFTIREAGEDCWKSIEFPYGMEMNQTETCENNSLLDREIILKPTRNDTSVMYETVYDNESENGNIELHNGAGGGGVIVTTPTTTSSKTTTRKPKTSTKRHKKIQLVDENSIDDGENDINYEHTLSSASAPATTLLYIFGLFLTACNLQNSIIVS